MEARQGAVEYQKNQDKLRNAKECITDRVIALTDLGAENSLFRNGEYYALRALRAIDTDQANFKKYAGDLNNNPNLDKRIKVALKRAIDYLN